MGSTKAIRGHGLVRLREDLSVFHPDGSKDVVRITNAIQRRNVALIVYVHPALAQLKSPCHLDIVHGLRKSLGYRLVKEREEARILYKVVQARDAVVPWRLRGEPAEYGARLGGRWWIG